MGGGSKRERRVSPSPIFAFARGTLGGDYEVSLSLSLSHFIIHKYSGGGRGFGCAGGAGLKMSAVSVPQLSFHFDE